MTIAESLGVDADVVAPETPSRGIAIVLQGRGDAPSHYGRLARRLATDGYTVVVPTDAVRTADDVVRVWAAHGAPAASEGVVVTLVAPDTAASHVAHAVADGSLTPPPAGVVFAGLAVDGHGPAADVADELTTRSACPVHRGVVERSGASELRASALAPEWPAALSTAVPTLVIHGGDDPIVPAAHAKAHLAGTGSEFVTVQGGLHDVLNDVHHRSVAGAIVQFLERLRLDPAATPILSSEVVA